MSVCAPRVVTGVKGWLGKAVGCCSGGAKMQYKESVTKSCIYTRILCYLHISNHMHNMTNNKVIHAT